MRLSILALSCTLLVPIVGQAHVMRRAPADAGVFASAADLWAPQVLRTLEGVPGFAMVVVVDDEVVLSRGYGQADIEHRLESTDETLYYIASATKPFTALLATMLDARGRIVLDDPLAAHLHGASLDAALRPQEVELRDLLTHTAGIDNPPLVWRLAYTGDYDSELLWKLLEKSIPMDKAPLGQYEYTNVGYNIYGLIVARETGRPWQDLMQEEIFAPLGMERTTASASRPQKREWPIAGPYYGLLPDGWRRVATEKTDATMHTAGGVFTTARDLGRWLEMQINAGTLDGRQVVDPALVRTTHAPLVEVTNDRPPFGQTASGLGWAHGGWRDRRVLFHGGGFPGYAALVSFMPEERIGVAVLVNETHLGDALVGLATVWAYDWWLQVPEAEGAASGMLDEMVARRDKVRAGIAADIDKRSSRSWTLSRPLADYVGRYANELYGTVEILAEEGTLAVRQGNLRCRAEPFTKPDMIRVEMIDGRGTALAFKIGAAGVDGLELQDIAYARLQ